MTYDIDPLPVLPLALRELTTITFTMSADLTAPSVVDHREHAIYVDVSAAPCVLEHLLRRSIDALRRGCCDRRPIV